MEFLYIFFNGFYYSFYELQVFNAREAGKAQFIRFRLVRHRDVLDLEHTLLS